MRDPYTVLGVTAEVSDDELRSVYLRLAQQNHPDRNQGREEAGARMKEINAAYEQILDWRKGKNIHTGFSPEGEALYEMCAERMRRIGDRTVEAMGREDMIQMLGLFQRFFEIFGKELDKDTK